MQCGFRLGVEKGGEGGGEVREGEEGKLKVRDKIVGTASGMSGRKG